MNSSMSATVYPFALINDGRISQKGRTVAGGVEKKQIEIDGRRSGYTRRPT
jgi:hypothetical protein